ncbi:peptidase M48 [Adhaeribacter arboris]|uniref:Peptidase M48 n=1 Tax=Adhaeribacter arboris TaxID=2072846 RepID=A0A2T2YCM0_9BACT|nr:M48 family metallopeptidase [Adhaeribacter arboris]PSR53236.1 peptidase M48 [Adhaeribacter arboris]
MWKKFLVYSSLLTVMSCATVPITGRRQLDLVSSSEMQQMSYASYKQVLDTAKVVTNTQNTAMVKRVGQRIQRAVEQYMAQNNLSDQLAGYAWEYNLIEDPQMNAWCMPGGKVVVYTGILPVTRDETGLAVVLGHEIAHAIARHGDERMSQGLLQQLGGATLQAAIGSNPTLTQNLFLTAFGAGSQLGLLAYGRTQESEADRLGLTFMAMAGYDPKQAITFWERMAAGKNGQAPPEFLSTHPSDETRIANIEKHMPEALKYYKNN